MLKLRNLSVGCLAVFAAVLVMLSPSLAAAPAEAVSNEIAAILSTSGRLPLPLERVRATLSAHYVKQGGSIYWANTGRMTPFLQRLSRANYDGLNPQDYPVDALTQLRDGADPEDARAAAEGELYYSAFFIAYAADLKIGRVAPQKVDPNLFRSRKTIDGLSVLTELKKQRDPGKFLAAFEPKNRHYQGLKRMLKAYTAAVEQGIDWPVISQGATLKPGQSDARMGKVRELLAFTGDYEGPEAGSNSLRRCTCCRRQEIPDPSRLGSQRPVWQANCCGHEHSTRRTPQANHPQHGTLALDARQFGR